MSNLLIKLCNLDLTIRRTICGFFIALFLFGFVTFGALIFNYYTRLHAALDFQKVQLGRYESLIQSSEYFLENIRISATSNSELTLSGANTSQARIELQKRVNNMARKSNIIISSTANAKDIFENEIQMLGLRIHMNGSLKGIQSLLFQIENSTPILITQRATIKATGNKIQGMPEVSLELYLYGASPNQFLEKTKG